MLNTIKNEEEVTFVKSNSPPEGSKLSHESSMELDEAVEQQQNYQNRSSYN